MKLSSYILVGIVLAGFGCAQHTKAPVMVNGVAQLSKAVLKPTIVANAGFQLAVLKVAGMSWKNSCPRRVRNAIDNSKAVKDFQADVDLQEVAVVFDPKLTTPQKLVDLINTKTNYEASQESL